ncbi:hypothetical protein ScPMuIL_002627 [Solemya velum]
MDFNMRVASFIGLVDEYRLRKGDCATPDGFAKLIHHKGCKDQNEASVGGSMPHVNHPKSMKLGDLDSELAVKKDDVKESEEVRFPPIESATRLLIKSMEKRQCPNVNICTKTESCSKDRVRRKTIHIPGVNESEKTDTLPKLCYQHRHTINHKTRDILLLSSLARQAAGLDSVEIVSEANKPNDFRSMSCSPPLMKLSAQRNIRKEENKNKERIAEDRKQIHLNQGEIQRTTKHVHWIDSSESENAQAKYLSCDSIPCSADALPVSDSESECSEYQPHVAHSIGAMVRMRRQSPDRNIHRMVYLKALGAKRGNTLPKTSALMALNFTKPFVFSYFDRTKRSADKILKNGQEMKMVLGVTNLEQYYSDVSANNSDQIIGHEVTK